MRGGRAGERRREGKAGELLSCLHPEATLLLWRDREDFVLWCWDEMVAGSSSVVAKGCKAI